MSYKADRDLEIGPEACDQYNLVLCRFKSWKNSFFVDISAVTEDSISGVNAR